MQAQIQSRNSSKCVGFLLEFRDGSCAEGPLFISSLGSKDANVLPCVARLSTTLTVATVLSSSTLRPGMW